MQYIAYVEEQEMGPLTYEGLVSMWQAEQVSDETHVRRLDSADWSTWGQVRGAVVAAKAKDRGLATTRRMLRRISGYPILRGCIVWLIVAGAIGIIASLLCLVSGEYMVGFGVFLSSLALIFNSFVVMAILDMADAALRKVE